MTSRNERRTGKPAKFETPKAGPPKAKPTPASMKGSKQAKSHNRGKR